MSKVITNRMRALTAIGFLALAVAPNVRAEAPAQPRPQVFCEPLSSAEVLDQCYALAGRDKAKRARCSKLSAARDGTGRALLCRRYPGPEALSTPRPTQRQIDLCYAWAGDDEVKLEACDSLPNAGPVR